MAAASNSFRKGRKADWKWSGGSTEGTVVERFDRRVQRTLKGSKVVRNGSTEDPAYLIEQDDSTKVLKLGSELDGA